MFREGKNTKRKGNEQMKWQKIENNPQLSTFFFCIFKNSRIFAITKSCNIKM